MATSMRSAPNFTAKCGTLTALLPLSLVQRQLEEDALSRWGTLAGETERWVLHTLRRLQSPKVRAFVDFLCALSERHLSAGLAGDETGVRWPRDDSLRITRSPLSG